MRPNAETHANHNRLNPFSMPTTHLSKRTPTRKLCAVSRAALMLPTARPTREWSQANTADQWSSDPNIKSLQAVGVVAVHTALDSSKDRDNAVATVEFDGGKIATLFCSRMMAAGQEDTTEIICKKGSLRVNMQGRKNHLEIHDGQGARRDLPKHYYERFREAFLTEANEFTASCLDNTTPPVSLSSSVKAVVIGSALQKSLVTGEKIVFDFGKEARL